MAFCMKCGKDMGDSQFCPNCGTPASGASVNAAPKAAPTTPPPATNPEAPAATPASAGPQKSGMEKFHEIMPWINLVLHWQMAFVSMVFFHLAGKENDNEKAMKYRKYAEISNWIGLGLSGFAFLSSLLALAIPGFGLYKLLGFFS